MHRYLHAVAAALAMATPAVGATTNDYRDGCAPDPVESSTLPLQWRSSTYWPRRSFKRNARKQAR